MSARAKLLAMFAIFIVPTLASFVVFYFFPPTKASNYGTLIVPVIALPKVNHLRLDAATPTADEAMRGKWLALIRAGDECSATCRDKLTLMRQTRLMLGREQDRVARVVLLEGDGARAPDETTRKAFEGTVWIDARSSPWRKALPNDAVGTFERIYLVDPLGNAFMFYDQNDKLDPAKFLKDLKQVLKASQIG
jgi:cytochrome oxidase Cu insertion factor (SCO1/SenC/PrrC family)